MTTAKKTSEEKKAAARYMAAVGRRKTATAQVRLHPVSSAKDTKEHLVNGKKLEVYFPTETLQTVFLSPLRTAGLEKDFLVSVVVSGGGVRAQAEAVRLGVARALVLHDELLRKTLRAAGHLTRDSRSVERKKPGLKKARRAPQWSKR